MNMTCNANLLRMVANNYLIIIVPVILRGTLIYMQLLVTRFRTLIQLRNSANDCSLLEK